MSVRIVCIACNSRNSPVNMPQAAALGLHAYAKAQHPLSGKVCHIKILNIDVAGSGLEQYCWNISCGCKGRIDPVQAPTIAPSLAWLKEDCRSIAGSKHD